MTTKKNTTNDVTDVILFTSIPVLFCLFQKLAEGNSSFRHFFKVTKALDANELVCCVTPDNNTLPYAVSRATMRRENLWHRATYVVIRHEPDHLEQHGNHPSSVYVLVQKRSQRKDYCPGRFDPTPGGVVQFGETCLANAKREIQEEMGIQLFESTALCALERLVTFPFEDAHVRVFGELFDCTYRGALKDLQLQKEEVDSVDRMSLQDLNETMNSNPEQFMPDSIHAMKLYLQRRLDMTVGRRLLKGYSSSDLDSYYLRPKPSAVFFDCDDCLYFNGWKTARLLSQKIEQYCVSNLGLRPGQDYELYKEYGTALRGLLAEGYLEDSEEAVNRYLQEVHDIPVSRHISRDENLRRILLRIDPSIPKYIFTASVRDHAKRCLEALGIDDLFEDLIDCKRCNLETKHSRHSFEVAMKVAG